MQLLFNPDQTECRSREIQIRTVSTRRPGGLRWQQFYMSNRRAKWDIARRGAKVRDYPTPEGSPDSNAQPAPLDIRRLRQTVNLYLLSRPQLRSFANTPARSYPPPKFPSSNATLQKLEQSTAGAKCGLPFLTRITCRIQRMTHPFHCRRATVPAPRRTIKPSRFLLLVRLS